MRGTILNFTKERIGTMNFGLEEYNTSFYQLERESEPINWDSEWQDMIYNYSRMSRVIDVVYRESDIPGICSGTCYDYRLKLKLSRDGYR